MSSPKNTPPQYRFDDLTVDCRNFTVAKDRQRRDLTPRAFDVLRYLIEHSDRVVEKQELFDQIWKERFVSDNALTRTIKEIRQALGDSADAPRYIETVPKRGYRFIAETQAAAERDPAQDGEVAGDVAAVEDGAEEESKAVVADTPTVPPAERPKSRGARAARRRLALAALAVSAVALGCAGIYLWAGRGERVDSVAVMPFVNVNGDPETEYLADGITEGVISDLSRLHGLRVMSRNAVFRYKGREIDPPAVGRELDVRAVLIGRIEQRGDDLSVSLELVDSEDSRQLWGGQYRRKLSEALRTQAEISRAVSEKLRRLTDEERRRLTMRHTENAEAHQFYLRGRHLLEKRTEETVGRSIEYFQRAVALDPDYALAHAELGWAWASLGHLGGRPSREAIPRAKEAVEKALALDETLAEAHFYSGHLSYTFDWDWLAAERKFKRALELDPRSAQAHRLYAHYLGDMGRADEAVAAAGRALALEPASVVINRDAAIILYFTRRYDEAIEQMQRTLELEPNMPSAHFFLSRAYEQKGLREQSVAAWLKYRALQGLPAEEEAGLRAAWARDGWRGFWRGAAKLLEKEEADGAHDLSYWRAEIHSRLHEKERALALLEKALTERSRHLTGLNAEPLWDELRSDAGFQDVVRRVGLTP